jgi:hypothetical protein
MGQVMQADFRSVPVLRRGPRDQPQGGRLGQLGPAVLGGEALEGDEGIEFGGDLATPRLGPAPGIDASEHASPQDGRGVRSQQADHLVQRRRLNGAREPVAMLGLRQVCGEGGKHWFQSLGARRVAEEAPEIVQRPLQRPLRQCLAIVGLSQVLDAGRIDRRRLRGPGGVAKEVREAVMRLQLPLGQCPAIVRVGQVLGEGHDD